MKGVSAMKKALAVLCFLLLPLTVRAMTEVTDSALSDVTGQAGVNFNGDIHLDVTLGTLAWGDADGISSSVPFNPWGITTDGGYVGASGLNITNLRIKARTQDTYNGYDPATQCKPITIDVATSSAMYDGRTFVRFGIGALQLTADALSFDVALGTNPAAGLDQVMGSVNLGPMGIYFNPVSYVDIYSHAGSGVNMTFNVAIDHFEMDYASWGDADGLPGGLVGVDGVVWMAPGATSAGYIGLHNLTIGAPITVTGTIAMDVATVSAGAYTGGAPGDPTYSGPTTVVHFNFSDNFSIGVGPIEAEVMNLIQ
jgi:hypothetical protein